MRWRRDFINSGYDLKALMREITNSDAYQLSARYNYGTAPADNLFARKLVRRAVGGRDSRRHRAIEQRDSRVTTW